MSCCRIQTNIHGQLKTINFEKADIYLKYPDVGYDAKEHLQELLLSNKISNEDYHKFFKRAKSFFKDVVGQLLKKLPIDNSILRDLQVLHPICRTSESSVEAIRRLAAAISLYPQDKIDEVVAEWRCFQVDTIPDEWLPRGDDATLCDSSSEDDDECDDNENWVSNRLDSYWIKVFKMKHLDGSLKYPQLTILVKLCLTLSHGNSDVERSFSENKLLLTSNRTRMSDFTLNGFRATSSYMQRHQSLPAKMPINTTILKSVRNARSNYTKRVEAQREV